MLSRFRFYLTSFSFSLNACYLLWSWSVCVIMAVLVTCVSIIVICLNTDQTRYRFWKAAYISQQPLPWKQLHAHFSNIKHPSVLYFQPVYQSSPRMTVVALTEKMFNVLIGRDLGTDKPTRSLTFFTHTLLSVIGRAYDQVRKALRTQKLFMSRPSQREGMLRQIHRFF